MFDEDDEVVGDGKGDIVRALHEEDIAEGIDREGGIGTEGGSGEGVVEVPEEAFVGEEFNEEGILVFSVHTDMTDKKGCFDSIGMNFF
jgi:hypothetical protein